jgi:hypothetical protein
MDPFSGYTEPAGDERSRPTEIIRVMGEDNHLMEAIRTICHTVS